MNEIIRDSKLPIYHQLYEILRANIVGGKWRPGDMLPSESELIEQYAVSRVTVRQAFEALVNDGLVNRQRGRGTFVVEPKVEQGLNRIISFTEDMRQRNYKPGTEILSAELIPAPADIADKLEISPNDLLARIERLRLADDQPMSIEQSHLVYRYCPNILQDDYVHEPLREILETKYGLRLVRAKQVVRAITASPKLASRLGVTATSALLMIERVTYSDQNIPVEFLRLYHRGDRYSLSNELTG